jgi:hypothetical protein
MCKWWNGTHVKNELIHQNTMLKFYGQIFGIQFVMDFKSCTKTHVESRINSVDSIHLDIMSFMNKWLNGNIILWQFDIK